MTLRTRLLLASLTTLAVGLGALVIAGNVLLAVRVGSEESGLLHAHAQAQIAALTVTGGGVRIRETANDTALDRRAWILDGQKVIERPNGVPAALDRAAVALGRARRSVDTAGPGDTHLLARSVTARRGGPAVGAVVVARSDAPVEALQQEVLVGSIAITLLVLLAGGVAIRSAVDGALRPVAQMTEQAEDWSAHDLDRRFSLGPQRDELTGLAATLDHMLARIASLRRHEQRFASEVAHELRTPIAGLRGRAELALSASGPEAEAERTAALESVIDQVDRVQVAVDTLLAIARDELDGTVGSVDLGALVAEYEGIETAVPADLPSAEGEPELVRRALTPLIENARRHARGRVVIELSETSDTVLAAVCDDGAGIDPALGDRIFEPGVQGDTSGGAAGLGLALARRLARSCGGDVTLEPADGGRVVLSLPIRR